MSGQTANIIGIIITLMLSGFFSGMEIAFVSSNRLRLEMDKGKNGLSQKAIDLFYRNSEDYISTMLVGNNIVLVVYGIFIANFFNATIFHNLPAAVQVPLNSVVSTIIVLFTGEYLPKTIFKNNANRLLTFFAPIAYIFYIVLYPICRFSTFLSNIILKIAGLKPQQKETKSEFSKTDLDDLVTSTIDKTGEDKVEDEVKIFKNALDFPDIKVRDCMVPRTEIQAVDIDCTTEELLDKFQTSGKSKIIVYKEDIDHVVGYIHISEMFTDQDNWRDKIRNMPDVAETMAANKLMQTFLQQKKNLGVVIDEFGGTSGIISLEDILENILGDIEDEHDNDEYVAKKTETGEYVLSARLEIDKINEKFDLDLPESEDYKTLGGMILFNYESFPKLNEVIVIGKYEFKILKTSISKIELVKLKVNEE